MVCSGSENAHIIGEGEHSALEKALHGLEVED